MTTTKPCKTCQRELALSEFRKQAAAPDGLQYSCKFCASEASKQRYEKKAKEIIAKTLQRRDPAKFRDYQRDYMAAHRHCQPQ